MTLRKFPVKLIDVNGKIKKTPATNGQSWKTYEPTEEEMTNAKNIGVIIPPGVVVIDLDTHKGIKAKDVENALNTSLKWKSALLQKTIKGGYHFAFRTDKEIKQGNDLLGLKGFDTRSSGKGWICTGEGYTGKALDKLSDISLLPELPEDVANKINGYVTSQSDDFETYLNNQPLDYSKEQTIKLIMSTPPINAPYQDWVEVGMAIHHQSQGNEWGFDLFNKWSMNCDNYDRREVVAKWKSFGKGSNPITLATIIAKYKDKADESKAVEEVTKPSRLTTINLNHLNQEPTKKRLIADRFPVGCTSALVAMGGVGKTTWLVKKAIELAINGQSTLFVSAEDGVDDYQSKIYNAVRSADTNVQLSDVANRLHVLDLTGVGTKLVVEERGSYRPSESVQSISKTAEKVKADLIVFETLSRFAGGEENERFEAVVTACDAIAKSFQGAVVLVHHTGKSQAREKVIDLYSGRGGSVLGDNTRSMTVITRLDEDYQGRDLVLYDQEDLLNGKLFEVSHVRCSYAQTVDPEYYATRAGVCNGPVLERLKVGTEEQLRELAIARASERDAQIMNKIVECIRGEGGQVMRRYFERDTRAKIGCGQKDSRAVISIMLDKQMIKECQAPGEGSQARKILVLNQGV